MLGKEALEKTLLDIDEEASLLLDGERARPRVIVVGGSAFMLHDLTARPATHDIDVLEADAAVRAILARYPTVNGSVAAHADEIPYNFEDRLKRIDLPTHVIDFYTPSLEDLTVMKLYAWRPNDISDLTSPQVLERMDWALLDKLVHDNDEARASALVERRYQEMVGIYEQYKEAYAR